MLKNIVIPTIAAIALVGLVAYLGVSRAPTQEQQEQGGQGMRKELTVTKVEDYQVSVSDDGKFVYLREDNLKKTIFSLEDLPRYIPTETHGERKAAWDAEFKSASLSPTKTKVAIAWESIDAWLGILELVGSKKFYPLIWGLQDEVVKSPVWSPNGRYVAIELFVAEGTGTSYIKIGDTLKRREVLKISSLIPELERVLKEKGIVVTDFESPRWLDENTLLFDMAGETWSIDVDGSNAQKVR